MDETIKKVNRCEACLGLFSHRPGERPWPGWCDECLFGMEWEGFLKGVPEFEKEDPADSILASLVSEMRESGELDDIKAKVEKWKAWRDERIMERSARHAFQRRGPCGPEQMDLFND